jgi:hypothetical protein
MFFGRTGIAFNQTIDAKQILRFRKLLKIKIRGKNEPTKNHATAQQ